MDIVSLYVRSKRSACNLLKVCVLTPNRHSQRGDRHNHSIQTDALIFFFPAATFWQRSGSVRRYARALSRTQPHNAPPNGSRGRTVFIRQRNNNTVRFTRPDPKTVARSRINRRKRSQLFSCNSLYLICADDTLWQRLRMISCGRRTLTHLRSRNLPLSLVTSSPCSWRSFSDAGRRYLRDRLHPSADGDMNI